MKAKQNYQILLVDDEPENIRNLFEILDSDFYQILVANNGNQAVALTARQKPDAIIMDWDMPDKNGLEATKAIRATLEIKDTPIIIATGKMTSAKNLKTALEAGANDYIRKPFEPIEIQARVSSMIRLRTEQQKIIELEKDIWQEKINRKQRELEINQQALTAFKARIAYNTRYIENLVSDLLELSKNTDKNLKRNMRSFIAKIRVDVKRENWQEFENHFEKIHPSFLKTIKENYSCLTQNEIELCMLFKLNMTTNEIVSLTHKTKETLKKARYRLRKKLGITQGKSLSEYIREIE